MFVQSEEVSSESQGGRWANISIYGQGEQRPQPAALAVMNLAAPVIEGPTSPRSMAPTAFAAHIHSRICGRINADRPIRPSTDLRTGSGKDDDVPLQ